MWPEASLGMSWSHVSRRLRLLPLALRRARPGSTPAGAPLGPPGSHAEGPAQVRAVETKNDLSPLPFSQSTIGFHECSEKGALLEVDLLLELLGPKGQGCA